MIIDLMDPTNYNNNYYKDRFLGNMYRIVSCHLLPKNSQDCAKECRLLVLGQTNIFLLKTEL